jgi:anti-sigma regulatory factor (Ser/Thr protein kinase)
MEDKVRFTQEFTVVGEDYINGGDASCKISNILKDIGVHPDIILKVSVASYEAEMNVVMYGKMGKIRLRLTDTRIFLEISDEGPGIEDIEQAMEPGYSTATARMREMGFGAGMGLPNIGEHSDSFKIDSVPGKGTRLYIIFDLG